MMGQMRGALHVLVCGGRDYADELQLEAVLDGLNVDQITHGGAPGADTLAKRWADARGITQHEFMARWDLYGTRAGPIRNARMLAEKPDLVVAFPGGKGTADMVRRARAGGVEVMEVA